MSDKHWKSCSGPLWAECHADMEAQESRIRALEAACRVLAAWVVWVDDQNHPICNLKREAINKDPLAAKYIEEARNG